MRYLWLLFVPFVLMFVPSTQHPSTSPDGSSLTVLSHKWSKTRQVMERPEAQGTGPALQPAMIPANKNYQRNVRINDPAGARDPNADTTDGRAAALEKIVQESRRPQEKPVDAFAYRVKLQNASNKLVDILFWEYQFIDSANPATITRRQFLCGVAIKPGKDFEVKAFSLAGPSEVVHVDSLAKDKENPFQEKVVINRVEFADGSIWQRKDWNFAEIRLTYQRAIATPWGAEMCRGL